MRRSAIAALFVLVAAPAAAQEAPAPLDPAIARCIRDNATKVEASVADLNAAVDFLTTKVCAEPIAQFNALAAKRQQDRMSAYWKDLCDKAKTDKTSKEHTNVTNWCDMSTNNGGLLAFSGADEDSPFVMFNTNAPAAATALAARLLLDLRLSHSNSGNSH